MVQEGGVYWLDWEEGKYCNKIIMEGRIDGRKRGRPRTGYIHQIKDKFNVVSYQDVKRRAESAGNVGKDSTDKSGAL